MQFIKRHRAVLLLLFSLLALAGTLALNLWLNQRHYVNAFFDFDGSSELMLGKILAQNGEWVFSSDWYYSSEIRFLHNQLVLAPLFRLISNPFTVQLIMSLCMGILMAGGAVFCLRGARLPWWVSILGASLCVSAFSVEWFNNLLANCYYSFFVANTFVFVGLVLRLACARGAKLRVLCIILPLFSFLLGMCGVRYAILVFLPLLAVLGLRALPQMGPALQQLFEKHTTLRRAARQFMPLLLTLCACVFYAGGFLVYQRVLSARFAVMNSSLLVFSSPHLIPTKIGAALSGLLYLLFPAANTVSILSFTGFLYLIKLAGLVLLLLSALALWRGRRALPQALRLYVETAWAIFFIGLFVCIFTHSVFEAESDISTRYLLLAVFPLVPCPAIWLSSKQLGGLQKGLCAVVLSALLVANPYALHRLLRTNPAAASVAYFNPSVFATADTLVSAGYTSGYTDFHFVSILNLCREDLPTARLEWQGEGLAFSEWLQPAGNAAVLEMEPPQFYLLPRHVFEEYAPRLTGVPSILYEDAHIIAVEFVWYDLLLH